MKLFISYAHKDFKTVKRLVKLPVVISRLQYADLTSGLRADPVAKMLSDDNLATSCLTGFACTHSREISPKLVKSV